MLSVLNGAIRLSWNSCCGGRSNEEKQNNTMQPKPLQDDRDYFIQKYQANQYAVGNNKEKDSMDIDSIVPNYDTPSYFPIDDQPFHNDSDHHNNNSLPQFNNQQQQQQQQHKTVKEEYRSKKNSSQNSSNNNQKFQSKNGQQKSTRTKNWTELENKLLMSGYQKYPNQWDKISQLVGTRNEKQCKQRWTKIKPQDDNKKKKPWSRFEDQQIIQMVNSSQDQQIQWGLIASKLNTGRNGKQVRERFINVLDPDIRKGNWTQQEDDIILSMFHKIGTKWSEISKHLQGRPENMVKNRFHSHIKKILNGHLQGDLPTNYEMRQDTQEDDDDLNIEDMHYDNINSNQNDHSSSNNHINNGNSNINQNSINNNNNILIQNRQYNNIINNNGFSNINSDQYEKQQDFKDIKIENDVQNGMYLNGHSSQNTNNNNIENNHMDLENIPNNINQNGFQQQNGVALPNNFDLNKESSFKSQPSFNSLKNIQDQFFISGPNVNVPNFSLKSYNSKSYSSYGGNISQGSAGIRANGGENHDDDLQKTLNNLRLKSEEAKQNQDHEKLKLIKEQLLNIQDSLPEQQ